MAKRKVVAPRKFRDTTPSYKEIARRTRENQARSLRENFGSKRGGKKG